MADEIKLNRRRRNDDSDYLNNTSRGAKAGMLPESLSSEISEISLQAARGQLSVVGVDVMI